MFILMVLYVAASWNTPASHWELLYCDRRCASNRMVKWFSWWELYNMNLVQTIPVSTCQVVLMYKKTVKKCRSSNKWATHLTILLPVSCPNFLSVFVCRYYSYVSFYFLHHYFSHSLRLICAALCEILSCLLESVLSVFGAVLGRYPLSQWTSRVQFCLQLLICLQTSSGLSAEWNTAWVPSILWGLHGLKLRIVSSWLWYRVLWKVGTEVSDKHSASIFRVSWRWWQYVASNVGNHVWWRGVDWLKR